MVVGKRGIMESETGQRSAISTTMRHGTVVSTVTTPGRTGRHQQKTEKGKRCQPMPRWVAVQREYGGRGREREREINGEINEERRGREWEREGAGNKNAWRVRQEKDGNIIVVQ